MANTDHHHVAKLLADICAGNEIPATDQRILSLSGDKILELRNSLGWPLEKIERRLAEHELSEGFSPNIRVMRKMQHELGIWEKGLKNNVLGGEALEKPDSVAFVINEILDGRVTTISQVEAAYAKILEVKPERFNGEMLHDYLAIEIRSMEELLERSEVPGSLREIYHRMTTARELGVGMFEGNPVIEEHLPPKVAHILNNLSPDLRKVHTQIQALNSDEKLAFQISLIKRVNAAFAIGDDRRADDLSNLAQLLELSKDKALLPLKEATTLVEEIERGDRAQADRILAHLRAATPEEKKQALQDISDMCEAIAQRKAEQNVAGKKNSLQWKRLNAFYDELLGDDIAAHLITPLTSPLNDAHALPPHPPEEKLEQLAEEALENGKWSKGKKGVVAAVTTLAVLGGAFAVKKHLESAEKTSGEEKQR